jgi:hypothetical protein
MKNDLLGWKDGGARFIQFALRCVSRCNTLDQFCLCNRKKQSMDSSVWMVFPIMGAVLVINAVSAAVTRCRLQRIEQRISQIENQSVIVPVQQPVQQQQQPLPTIYYPPLQQPQVPVYRATAPPGPTFMSM